MAGSWAFFFLLDRNTEKEHRKLTRQTGLIYAEKKLHSRDDPTASPVDDDKIDEFADDGTFRLGNPADQ